MRRYVKTCEDVSKHVTVCQDQNQINKSFLKHLKMCEDQDQQKLSQTSEDVGLDV